MDRFEEFFAALPDPRTSNARHDLSEVLLIGFAAALCGAESCVDMADFGRAERSALERLVRLEHGVPSHDTFSRVFRLLDPQAFEACFRRFMAGFAAALAGAEGRIVALDGKSLSAACEAGARTTPLHLVSAWAAEQRLVLGQRRAAGRSETQAALALVALLDLKGCTVTADALHGTGDDGGRAGARRRPRTIAKGQCRREPRPDAPPRPQPAPPQPRQSLHPT